MCQNVSLLKNSSKNGSHLKKCVTVEKMGDT